MTPAAARRLDRRDIRAGVEESMGVGVAGGVVLIHTRTDGSLEGVGGSVD